MRARLLATSVVAVACGPVVTSLGPFRRRVLPRLAGISDKPHIALTYDDGPDPASTPQFLDLLDRHERRATFFLLGSHVDRNRGLVKEMSDRGHELAVHGWDHVCLVLKRPGSLAEELTRTADVIEDASGSNARWYRPPYGVVTTEGLLAARRAQLSTVLWSAWGRDWSSRATPQSIIRAVSRQARAGGTVLLHDSDRTSAPRAWVNTLAASDQLLAEWGQQEIVVGRLAEHWHDPNHGRVRRVGRPRPRQPWGRLSSDVTMLEDGGDASLTVRVSLGRSRELNGDT